MSTSIYHTQCGSATHQQQVDAAAEREAAALQWFHDNLDAQLPEHMGVNPTVRTARYSMAASLAAHRRLETMPLSKLVWGSSKKSRDITTAADRQRRAARKIERMARLIELEQRLSETPDAVLPRRDVYRTIGCGASTVDHGVTAGEFQTLVVGDERVIPAVQVAEYLRRRLAPGRFTIPIRAIA